MRCQGDGLGMTSIAVMNAKGGVGKSTLTMAIAETLADQHGKSSLIIDSDGQMSLSLMMARGQLLAERAEAKLSLVSFFVQKVLEGKDIDWTQYVCRDISDVDDIGGLFMIQGDMDLPLLERADPPFREHDEHVHRRQATHAGDGR